MYTKEYMKHFSNPLNVGEMEEADAIEDVNYKGQGCFDKVRIFVRLDGEKIAKVTYQTRGCSGTIAACSAISEMAVGMDLDHAAALTGFDIAESLGGVPEKKQHSMDLAAEALRTALQNFNS
jgi:nitrogen fixation NifU-like protein